MYHIPSFELDNLLIIVNSFALFSPFNIFSIQMDELFSQIYPEVLPSIESWGKQLMNDGQLTLKQLIVWGRS